MDNMKLTGKDLITIISFVLSMAGLYYGITAKIQHLTLEFHQLEIRQKEQRQYDADLQELKIEQIKIEIENLKRRP
jgi:Holliday junction resolvase